MPSNLSVIGSPEFVNLQPLDINPLMSACEIKVLYVGANRNRSYISKEVATEMSKTLRGAPIVGYYKESKEDFDDHGSQVVLQGESIEFNCLTKPYGFVSPDAEVWFQKFQEEGPDGEVIEREYLMTTGYLWTGQFEEAKLAADNEGRGQSMELDEDTLDGQWSKKFKNGMDFFIINDAIFSKLCILGEDVEPCFEGARVSAPQISSTFSKTVDDNFKHTLFTMMQELTLALKGGTSMEDTQVTTTAENEAVVSSTALEEVSEAAPIVEAEASAAVEEPIAYAKDEDDKKKEEEDKKETPKEDEEKESDSKSDDKADEEEDDKKKKYSLLKEEFDQLATKFSALQSQYDELVAFKNSVEDAKKDELISSFYMLSDEDKKDVLENKSKYSYDEIEAKLSVIGFRKKVNFDLDNSSQNDVSTETEIENITTYSLNETVAEIPAWLKAVKDTVSARENV